MKREYDCEVIAGKPQVAYRETITPARRVQLHAQEADRRLGPVRQGRAATSSRCPPSTRPASSSWTRSSAARSRASSSPPSRRASARRSRRAPLIGFPVVGVRVRHQRRRVPRGRLVGHRVPGRPRSWASARRYTDAKPTILEPIMKVEVEVPEEFQGASWASSTSAAASSSVDRERRGLRPGRWPRCRSTNVRLLDRPPLGDPGQGRVHHGVPEVRRGAQAGPRSDDRRVPDTRRRSRQVARRRGRPSPASDVTARWRRLRLRRGLLVRGLADRSARCRPRRAGRPPCRPRRSTWISRSLLVSIVSAAVRRSASARTLRLGRRDRDAADRDHAHHRADAGRAQDVHASRAGARASRAGSGPARGRASACAARRTRCPRRASAARAGRSCRPARRPAPATTAARGRCRRRTSPSRPARRRPGRCAGRASSSCAARPNAPPKRPPITSDGAKSPALPPEPMVSDDATHLGQAQAAAAARRPPSRSAASRRR